MEPLEHVHVGAETSHHIKADHIKTPTLKESTSERIFKSTLEDKPLEGKPIGHVTVLIGTSSVGKSSIIAALKEFDPSLEESGPDLVGYQSALNFLELQEIVPREDYQFLKSVLKPKTHDVHILDAISGGSYEFREDVSKEEKEKAILIAQKLKTPTDQFAEEIGKNIEEIMFDKVLAFSKEGKNAIFDTLFVDNVFKHHISRAPIKTVLIYCPFHELTNRLEKRNKEALEKGNKSEIRPGPYPLFQFAKLFGPKQEPSDRVIDVITRAMVEDDFDKNFNAWIEIEEVQKLQLLREEDKEKRLHEIEERRESEKQILLAALGFTDPSIEEIELTPRSKRYDEFIDTSRTKPPESAEILKRLHVD